MKSEKQGGKGQKGKASIACLAVKYVRTVNGLAHYGCAAKKCSWLQDGHVAEDCLLKQAECKHLSSEDHSYANSLQAGSSLGAKLFNTIETSASSSSASTVPALKSKLYINATSAGQKTLQEKMDFCIMKLICVAGLVPNILDSDEWHEFMHVANPKYKVTSSSTFEDQHIHKEAANVHHQTVDILCQYHNLTFTFDGNNTRGHESVYTGHFTTPNGCTFLFLVMRTQQKVIMPSGSRIIYSK